MPLKPHPANERLMSSTDMDLEGQVSSPDEKFFFFRCFILVIPRDYNTTGEVISDDPSTTVFNDSRQQSVLCNPVLLDLLSLLLSEAKA